jgi:hypothetical protein
MLGSWDLRWISTWPDLTLTPRGLGSQHEQAAFGTRGHATTRRSATTTRLLTARGFDTDAHAHAAALRALAALCGFGSPLVLDLVDTRCWISRYLNITLNIALVSVFVTFPNGFQSPFVALERLVDS